MSITKKGKIFIEKEHSPIKGEFPRNLNVKIPGPLLTKLRIKAGSKGKFVKDYILDIIEKDTEGIEVNIK
jgi:predicted DNA binding CopG/RHH family protein